jgi:hypothetical protein
VPFGGKLLLCSSNVGTIVSASNCSAAGYISKSDCPEKEGKADEESCKSFVDAKECPADGNKPEAFYTEPWCKSKYAALNTSSKFCTDAITAYTAYIASLATLFNGIRLVKASQGTTVKFFYDPASTAASPSPVTLTVAAIEVNSYKTKTITEAGIFALLNNTEFGKISDKLRGGVMEHLSTTLGVVLNDDAVAWTKGSDNKYAYAKSATKLTGDAIHKYTVIPGLWTNIGAGSTWTYSYLNLTAGNQTAILNDLKKKDISRYSEYCL